MRRYDKEIKSIKKKFDAKLKELYLQDKESILAFIWFRRIHKTNISKERKQQVITEACKEFNADGLSNNEFIAYLIEKQQKVKNIIDDFLIKRANDYLMNTNYSVKEIASMLEFSDSTAFINFYKYHENTTPTKFRNTYSKIHMNKK